MVPSKPGGAVDLTCKLVQQGLKASDDPQRLRISYLPGGIGAVAWHSLVSQRRANHNTMVAFSGGSLLDLAQASSAR
ncbi:hypothetical protein ACHMW6_26035 [Pseudoduganella sp. UC29_106]|uniref:hypothetical protein n=1 Tax=Pseudoduganella sp. UC29_106 TaxID=3374553 RepID=UPI003757C085